MVFDHAPRPAGRLFFDQGVALPCLLAALLVTLQLTLIFLFPVIADEAYFVSWGRVLSLGYYDHPPMTGWIAWLFHFLPGQATWLRFFSFTLGLCLCGQLFVVARRFLDAQKALLLALAWLALPGNVIAFSQYLNDSLVYFFSMSFLLCVHESWRAYHERRGGLAWAALAGLLLGFALLTKYLAGLYVLALLLVLLVRIKKSLPFLLTRLTMTALLATALFALNIYWNYFHCFINLTFNFYYRTDRSPVYGLGEFLVTLAFVLGPFLLLFFSRRLFFLRQIFSRQEAFFSPLFAATVVIIFLVALTKGRFAIHWGLPLSFLGCAALAETGPRDVIGKTARGNFGYLAAGCVVVVLALTLVFSGHGLAPEKSREVALGLDFYQDVQDGSLGTSLRENFPTALCASPAYSLVAILNNHDIDAVFLFSLSKFGRNDDIFVDYAALAGRNFLIFELDDDPALTQYKDSFAQTMRVTVSGQRNQYHAVYGTGFDYERYRKNHILPLREKFYRPIFGLGQCYMDRYADSGAADGGPPVGK